jgi:MtfA peptidase
LKLRWPSRLAGSVRTWRESRALQRRAIDDALWDEMLARHPFVAQRSAEERSTLRRLSSLFLDHKEFSGVDNFEVTDRVAVSVAAQACLPVLNLGLSHYDSFVGIVMHADEVKAPRTVDDAHGLVHEYDEVISGEAMQGGPIMLSWTDADAPQTRHSAWAYNVVVHEFVHVLDLTNGAADGMPALPHAADKRHWMAVMQAQYDTFRERVVCGHDLGLDPYGATSIDEFFAVASESFFVTPQAFMADFEALYGLLAAYYRQDPARTVRP